VLNVALRRKCLPTPALNQTWKRYFSGFLPQQLQQLHLVRMRRGRARSAATKYQNVGLAAYFFRASINLETWLRRAAVRRRDPAASTSICRVVCNVWPGSRWPATVTNEYAPRSWLSIGADRPALCCAAPQTLDLRKADDLVPAVRLAERRRFAVRGLEIEYQHPIKRLPTYFQTLY